MNATNTRNGRIEYRMLKSLPRDFLLFMAAVVLFGFSQSIFNSIFNNFLNESFAITDFQRGLLELPREMPGFLVVFYSAAFSFLSYRRLAALSFFFAAAGTLLLALYTPNYAFMLGWLFIFSTGQHLFLPLAQSIGMEFAGDGRTGKYLGRQVGIMNFAAIAGSFLVYVGFRFLNFNFSVSFAIAAVCLLIGSACLFRMKPDDPVATKSKIVLKKEYMLFYWLNILFGTRKQIFLTFAPWVLVTIFNQTTATVATLLTVGGIVGIGFNPLLGKAIDHLGERAVLMAEAAVLIFVCLGYGFSKTLFGGTIALMIACICFLLDLLLMSVSMARATWIKKIAVDPADVPTALNMGVTIDHVFSITIALVSGVIWLKLGYQYVFLLGAFIAVANLVSASFVQIPAGRKRGA